MMSPTCMETQAALTVAFSLSVSLDLLSHLPDYSRLNTCLEDGPC